MTTKQDKSIITIAVLGGTGKEGSGLAVRWAHAGYKVIIGSRDAARGAEKATELNQSIDNDTIEGLSNEDAAKRGDLIVLSVPYSAHRSTLESVKDHLDGKIVVDVTVPTPYKAQAVEIPAGFTAAQEAQAFLGEGVKVVSAFQNVGAAHLKKTDHPVDCDVLVTGDDADAKQEVIQLVKATGMRGIDAGPLANAIAAEALTAVLIHINKTYKVRGAGIRITGLA